MLQGREYAKHYVRVMARPWLATDDEIAQLTPEDQALVGLRCDIVLEGYDNAQRASVGLPPKPPKRRLSDVRLAELCELARNGGSPSVVPLDEYEVLIANAEQFAAYERALGEGFDRLMGCAAGLKRGE